MRAARLLGLLLAAAAALLPARAETGEVEANGCNLNSVFQACPGYMNFVFTGVGDTCIVTLPGLACASEGFFVSMSVTVSKGYTLRLRSTPGTRQMLRRTGSEGKLIGTEAGLPAAQVELESVVVDGQESPCLSVLDGARLDVWDSVFQHCVASGSGGAVFAQGAELTFRSTSFAHCEAGTSGGAVYAEGDSALTILDSQCSNCKANNGDGGCFYAANSATNRLTVNNTAFADNYAAKEGAALFMTDSTDLMVANSSFIRGDADDEGGGISVENPLTDSTLYVLSSIFDGNAAGSEHGAGFDVDDGPEAFAVVRDCIFTNHVSTKRGAAIAVLDSPISISRCIFDGNHANEGGGAIRAKSSGDSPQPEFLHVDDCLFLQNTGDQTSGAIYTNLLGETDIIGSTFKDNKVVLDVTETQSAGGLLAVGDQGGTLFVLDSHFADNRVEGEAADIYAACAEFSAYHSDFAGSDSITAAVVMGSIDCTTGPKALHMDTCTFTGTLAQSDIRIDASHTAVLHDILPGVDVNSWSPGDVIYTSSPPSIAPSVASSTAPSIAPSVASSTAPSTAPSVASSTAPSTAPSIATSTAPSIAPSAAPVPTTDANASVSAVIVGPNEVGTCADTFLQLDASLSSSSIPGDALAFLWTLSACTGLADATGSSVTISAAALTACAGAGSLTAKVNVTSTLAPDAAQAQAQAVRVVSIVTTHVPYIAVRGPDAVTIAKSDELVAYATVRAPCNDSTSTVTTTWSSVEGRSIHLQPDTTKLVVHANTLDAGSVFHFNAVATASAVSATATLTVTVRASDLVCSIRGGDRQSTSGTDVVFSADVYDPDDDSAVSVSWSVNDTASGARVWTSGAVPLLAGARDATVTVPGAVLVAGQEYIVHTRAHATAAADDRAREHTVRLDVIAGSALDVQIFVEASTHTTDHRINEGQRLVLRGAAPSAPSASLVWQLPNVGGLILRSSSRTGEYLVVDGLSSAASTPYTFSLDGSDLGATGSVSITVSVNAAPQAGRLTASPSTAIAFEEDVTLRCDSWSDDDTPLRFTFSYTTDGSALQRQQVVLTRLTQSNTVTEPLGTDTDGATATAYCEAVDALGAASTVSQTVTLQLSGSLDRTAELQRLATEADNVRALLGDGERAVAQSGSLGVLIGGSSVSATNKATLRAQLLDTVSASAQVVDAESEALHQQAAACSVLSADADDLAGASLSTLDGLTESILSAHETAGGVVVLKETLSELLSVHAHVMSTAHRERTVVDLVRETDLARRDLLSPGEEPLELASAGGEIGMSVTELDTRPTASAGALTFIASSSTNAEFEVPQGALSSVQSALQACGGKDVGASLVGWLTNPRDSTVEAGNGELLSTRVSSLSFRDCTNTELSVLGLAESDRIEMDIPAESPEQNVEVTWKGVNPSTISRERELVHCDGKEGNMSTTVECPVVGGGKEKVDVSFECAEDEQWWYAECPVTWVEAECVFWDYSTNVWNNTGCNATGYDRASGRVHCVCSHLTEYGSAGERYASQARSVVSEDVSEGDVRRNLGVVLTLGVMWVLYGLAVTFGGRVDMREDSRLMSMLREKERLAEQEVSRAPGQSRQHMMRRRASTMGSVTGAFAAPQLRTAEEVPSTCAEFWQWMKLEHPLLLLFKRGGSSKPELAGLRFRYRATVVFGEILTLLFVSTLLYERELFYEEWAHTIENAENSAEVIAALLEGITEALLSVLFWVPVSLLIYSGLKSVCRARVSAAKFAEGVFLQRHTILEQNVMELSRAQLYTLVLQLQALHKLCKAELHALRISDAPDAATLHNLFATEVHGPTRLKLSQARRHLQELERAREQVLRERRDAMLAQVGCLQRPWVRLGLRQVVRMQEDEKKLTAFLECLTPEQQLIYAADQHILHSLRKTSCLCSMRAWMYRTFVMDSTSYADTNVRSYAWSKVLVLGTILVYMVIATAYVLLFTFRYSTVAVLRSLISLVFGLALDVLLISPIVIVLCRVSIPRAVLRITSKEVSAGADFAESFVFGSPDGRFGTGECHDDDEGSLSSANHLAKILGSYQVAHQRVQNPRGQMGLYRRAMQEDSALTVSEFTEASLTGDSTPLDASYLERNKRDDGKAEFWEAYVKGSDFHELLLDAVCCCSDDEDDDDHDEDGFLRGAGAEGGVQISDAADSVDLAALARQDILVVESHVPMLRRLRPETENAVADPRGFDSAAGGVAMVRVGGEADAAAGGASVTSQHASEGCSPHQHSVPAGLVPRPLLLNQPLPPRQPFPSPQNISPQSSVTPQAWIIPTRSTQGQVSRTGSVVGGHRAGSGAPSDTTAMLGVRLGAPIATPGGGGGRGRPLPPRPGHAAPSPTSSVLGRLRSSSEAPSPLMSPSSSNQLLAPTANTSRFAAI